MTWKFYNSVTEGLKLKAIKILGRVFLRLLSYREKTGGGGLFTFRPILNTVKTLIKIKTVFIKDFLAQSLLKADCLKVKLKGCPTGGPIH